MFFSLFNLEFVSHSKFGMLYAEQSKNFVYNCKTCIHFITENYINSKTYSEFKIRQLNHHLKKKWWKQILQIGFQRPN